jgi:hypothetical protein
VIALALGAPVRSGGLIGAAAAAEARVEPTSNKANLERMWMTPFETARP